MQGHRRGLEKCALFEADIVGEGNRVQLRHTDIFREAAEFTRTDKAVMLAQGIIPPLAVIAFQAGNQRDPGHTVARFQACHALPGLDNGSGKLMAKHIGEIMAGIRIHPRYVRPADAGILDLDQNPAGPGLRRLDLFITNIIFRVHNSGFHDCICLLHISVPAGSFTHGAVSRVRAGRVWLFLACHL